MPTPENEKEKELVEKLIRLAKDGQLSPEKIMELAEKSNAADKYYERGRTFISIDRDETFEYFQAAYKLYSEIGNPMGKANTLHWLGVTSRADSEWDKAIEYEKKAYDIYSELNHKEGMGETIHNIGYCYYYLGKYKDAIPYFEKSIEIYKELGELSRVRDGLFNLASSYKELEDYTHALRYYRQAYEVLDDSFRSETIEKIEIILDVIQQKKEIDKELREEIDIAKELSK